MVVAIFLYHFFKGQISIKEPIQIEIKPNRTGIGHEKHRDEKHKELCEAHMEQMRKRARLEVVFSYIIDERILIRSNLGSFS